MSLIQFSAHICFSDILSRPKFFQFYIDEHEAMGLRSTTFYGNSLP